MFARAAFPDLPDHDLALPTLLMETLPPLVGALGLAALFSAEVSSSDAILFVLSTSLSQDLYRRFVRPSATDADLLRVARWAAACGGAMGTGLAIVSESIAGHPDSQRRARSGRSDAGDVWAGWCRRGLGRRLGFQDAIRAVSLRAASRTAAGIS